MTSPPPPPFSAMLISSTIWSVLYTTSTIRHVSTRASTIIPYSPTTINGKQPHHPHADDIKKEMPRLTSNNRIGYTTPVLYSSEDTTIKEPGTMIYNARTYPPQNQLHGES